ncbi:DUF3823 domain-containing protein [Mucilaginibacter sp. X5P1]|uniref:DUF3823 domain-containing protein n=1 Tax=Mucilaginibacter sp. X5P1 TaxID=2723088 RepID=UPI00160FAD6C|nr:DUF3823 domain-containing protein [Mucilaginibacter sp. X5P1]MBB6138535.1 hypothetical protein [Mucilaginibacter sp. X5P1]
MKKLFYYTAFCLAVIAGNSCSKIDNYPAPSDTINGSTIDEGTGATVQTEIGGGGTRVKLLEISYSANPTPEYFQSMQDGTFNDDKIFAATYKVSVEGPFVPLVTTDNTGTVTADSSQTIKLTSKATLNFKVQPFLRVEWVGKPVFNADSTVTVQVKITRGTSNPNYQQDITDINLYVSNTQYDGNNNYDPRYSKLVSYGGSTGTALLGQVITITTTGGAMPAQDVYFRVGARINAGLDEYNYNAPMSAKYP